MSECVFSQKRFSFDSDGEQLFIIYQVKTVMDG